ncbi:N-acetylglucosamine-specific PTS transporter subunit IIBC [Andreprevotia chitinilytica]|uniref:N-acetylglucosamine-specific PTS transporter subunit IIBC n=1 Tax=Andreprevotia chitinilytica TaxID=396808 RepID=UPI0005562E86|nr:N-acetylglucosamine-specific PTS transporter subunit IIBC [Andreprevotia chitinilytica]
MSLLGGLQKLGRSLQLPIAALPVAALMLRIGQPDIMHPEVFGSIGAFVAAGGDALFANLALLFAIGVAVGWAKDGHGSAALAGAVGYYVLTKCMDNHWAVKAWLAANPHGKIGMGVLAGILAGWIAGMLYNRFHDIKLPDWAAFFGGKRFVPIITGLAMLVLALVLGYVWPPIQTEINAAGNWIVGQGALGAGIFATVNRLLIPTGLHQLLNSIAWFQIGDFNTVKDGVQTVVHGDLSRFFAGDKTAGMFMTGFFPVMMFGLPGAALAMYFAAPKERRPVVGGVLFSVAFTAFLTGVTEPLEFLFMFLAPALYLVHAVLTGISAYILTALDSHLGFGFSAGAFDLVLNWGQPASSNQIYVVVVGVIWFVIYFALFSFFIKAFNLKTPGREDAADTVESGFSGGTSGDLDHLAAAYLGVVGGAANLTAIDACITRLRLNVNDSARVNEMEAKLLGASGVVKLNKQTVQIIVGPKAEMVADAMRKLVTGGVAPAVTIAQAPIAPAQKAAAASTIQTPPPAPVKGELVLVAPVTGDIVPLSEVPDAAFASKAVGDGVAIKPTGRLVVAPTSGTLVKIFNSNHAFALQADNGAEIIVHIGIETVKLGGQGFRRLAEQGTHVNAGEPVLELDLDYLNEHAQSLISPIVISNIDQFGGLTNLASGAVAAGQSPLYTLKPR